MRWYQRRHFDRLYRDISGLHCARLDGTPLIYNCEDTYVHDLLICRKELVGAVTAALTDSTIGNG